MPQSAGHVRSIVPMNMAGLDGLIYVATTKNKILEGSLQLKFTLIIQVQSFSIVQPIRCKFDTEGYPQSMCTSLFCPSHLWQMLGYFSSSLSRCFYRVSFCTQKTSGLRSALDPRAVARRGRTGQQPGSPSPPLFFFFFFS